ncbi:2TM domain-containing protein [Synechocystis sp. PCC 7509]|uniref:2TM domain-containing protein n=1 Tax=Synechocystis sp. PCC 7509 TaxID=927677 RepID=UPI0002ACECC9|nr:2TM domain-containing protein [Synechocystis sp. PCC 7509]
MTSYETKIVRSYSQEDIQQILSIAIARQSDDTEFSYQQLVEIAEELEITPEALQQSEIDWRSQNTIVRQKQTFDLFRRNKLKKKLGNYAIANSFLVLLDLLNSGDLSWSLYILLIWGLKVGLDSWNTYYSNGEEYERAFQRWSGQNQLKQSVNTVVSKINKWLKA